jgi:hypothetical protein
MHIFCNDGETGFAAKVVLVPGEVIVALQDQVLRFATPCNSRVVLHALTCDGMGFPCETYSQ